MKKQTLPRDLKFLAILTLVTVFTWIMVDVYHAFRKATPPQVPAAQLEPLNPKLETGIIDSLIKRDFYTKEDFGAVLLPTPTSSTTESGKLKKP